MNQKKGISVTFFGIENVAIFPIIKGTFVYF